MQVSLAILYHFLNHVFWRSAQIKCDMKHWHLTMQRKNFNLRYNSNGKSVHYTAGKHSYTLSVSRKTENSMYSLYTHPKRYLCFSNCHNLLLCMFVQTTFLLYTILHFILSFLHNYRIVSLLVINNHNLLV